MKWYLTILMTVFAFNKLSVVPRLRSNWWNCGGERMSALEFKQRLSHIMHPWNFRHLQRKQLSTDKVADLTVSLQPSLSETVDALGCF